MNWREYFERLMLVLGGLSLLYILITLLAGCKIIQPTERIIYKTDTVRTHQRDSIFYHYTDTVLEKQKGDTLYIEKIKWRTAYKEYLRSDTIVKTDSIYHNDVVTVAKMNGFQSTFFWVGIILTILVILYIVLKILKKVYLK